MEKLNVVVGKIGKSMLFNKHKWGMIGGDSEAPALISMLAQMNPNINFYILGRSDWKKVPIEIKEKINVNNNIIDIWENYDSKKIEETHWPNVYFERFKTDIHFGIIMSGPAGASSITEAMWTIDQTRVAKPSEMFRRYVGPITRYLNDSGIPYCELGEDPRYVPCAARDLFNRPKEILSTRDNVGLKVKYISEYMSKKIIETEIPSAQFHVDKLFMMSEPYEKLLKTPGNRTNLISVYSNGLTDTGGMKKYPHVKEYVLENFFENGATIFGQWPEEQIEDPEYKDRFISTPMSELTDQMYNTKYSFMIPIQAGWPSSKFWKHLMFGIIPFWHPLADVDRTAGSPEFLRLKSAEDFHNKIHILESNPDQYRELWNACRNLLKEEYFSGKFYNDLLLDKLEEQTGIITAPYKAERLPFDYKMSCLYEETESIKTKALF